jgi:sulfur carrier protein ThiS
MNVRLRNPQREVEFDRSMNASALLDELGINRESALVIVDGTLVPLSHTIAKNANVEVRNVISGGAR